MTKYTDEQIIAYLKTLREGDVLIAARDGDYYTEGDRYAVSKDLDGDMHISDDGDNPVYVNMGDSYDICVARRIRDGIFEIPAQASAKPFELTITQAYPTAVFDDKSYYIVHASVDGAGLERLRALEAEGKRASVLAELYAKRGALQAQIDDLEAAQ